MSRSLRWLSRKRPSEVSFPDPAALVSLAYRAVLRRDADPDGIASYVKALSEGRDLAWLVTLLASSTEFQAATRSSDPFPLDQGQPMPVKIDADAAGLQALWDRVAAAWSRLGEADPYWSVLTETRFRAGNMDAAALSTFYETGEGEVHRLKAWLRRNGATLGTDGVCMEYGCGVGRVTRTLARRFRRVVAFDISPPHLHAAAAQIAADGIGNVDFVQVRGPTDLQALDGADLFYSVITLQHSPPPIIMDVLRHAFAGLRQGGCAFFQVPTYAVNYTWPEPGAAQEGMEMHFVPQHAILKAAYEAGLRVLEIQPDGCTGRIGDWISNTFLLQKG